jgi:uncharacterized protein
MASGPYDVALATSAAPTFLPSFIGSSGTTLVDGGVWANCPAALAVVESLTNLRQPIGSIDLLTVGTTEEPLHVANGKALGGLLQWVRFAPELLMHAQAKGALAQAKLLTGNRMLRITELVAPGRFKLHDPICIRDLQALGERAARHHEREVSERYLACSQVRSGRSPRKPWVWYDPFCSTETAVTNASRLEVGSADPPWDR